MVEVIVVGAGPVGMMLAGELMLAGVDVVIAERRSTTELVGSRAGGFHARTIELLDQRGIADRFLAKGKTRPVPYAGTMLDISDFPTRHPYTLGIMQNDIERILAEWLDELAVPVLRDREVIGLAQGGTEVELRLADGETWHAPYVVGADGGRSVIRRAAGISFPGWDKTTSALIAEVEVTEPLPEVTYDANGIHGLSYLADGRTVRVVTSEPVRDTTGDPTLADLSTNLIAVFGTDFGVHHPTWISRFTDTTRQAATYRRDRVLLAGDAAHIHSPAGGQGIGLGIQDAVNLGWKLAQVVQGISTDSLLDTYHAERHPADARSLQYTMAASALQRQDPRIGALRDLMTAMVGFAEPRTHLAGLISGLDVHYDLGEGHALLGRRMPDLDLITAEGSTRVFTLLHRARPVLIAFDEPRDVDLGIWADRVQLVDAACDGPWELPVIGAVSAPTAVLVRPDGHVAWVGEGSTSGLADALMTWCGARPQRFA